MMPAREYATMRRVEDTHWWYRTLRRRVTSDLRHWLAAESAAATILDAGCGTGGMLEWLGRWGDPRWQLHAVDISPVAVAMCRARGLSRVHEGDVAALPYATQTFDAVLSLDVLYGGAVDEAAAVRECHRVLRPGGVALFNCAAYECLRGRHDMAVGGARRYTPGRLRAVLEDAGFHVVMIHGWNAWAFMPTAVWRRLSRGGPAESARSDLFQAPAWLDRCVGAVAAADMALCRWLRHPVGTSLYAVALKDLDAR